MRSPKQILTARLTLLSFLWDSSLFHGLVPATSHSNTPVSYILRNHESEFFYLAAYFCVVYELFSPIPSFSLFLYQKYVPLAPVSPFLLAVGSTFIDCLSG
jgi:hypothetical protein